MCSNDILVWNLAVQVLFDVEGSALPWNHWEISKAVELKKKIVAVKIESTNTTPGGLLNVGAKWVMSFSFDSIKKAIEST